MARVVRGLAAGGAAAGSVICTHFHPDHAGLAGGLCRKFDARLWMTRGEWLTLRVLTADARETSSMRISPSRAARWTVSGGGSGGR